ncbi:MAG: FHA domain-containing protein [Pyrinomonadaceae bacterium]
MADLILKFTDENGARRSVAVTTNNFSIGRTPDNNLPIASSALSRKHAEIQRFGDVFIITDNGSSNGTRLNEKALNEPIALQDGDKLTLGGAIEIMVEIVGNAAVNYSGNQDSNFSGNSLSHTGDEATPFWQSVYFIAPVFGVVALLLVGVLVFALSSKREQPVIAEVNRELPEDPPEESNRRSPRNRNSDEEENGNLEEPPVNRRVSSNENSNSETPPTNSNTGGANSENEKIEGLALQFLRRISDNQNPVLNLKQVTLINAKIKSLKNSAAFRDNLRAASKNAAGFEKAGQTHNLRGAFLAAAALAKLGDSRGDAMATATVMAPDLQKYSLVLGNELANDNLLAIAAYVEGNPPNTMRDRVANLTTLTPGATAATVRTIWFLHDNGKLSEPAFDFAVRFIAAGTLLQNPSAFNL